MGQHPRLTTDGRKDVQVGGTERKGGWVERGEKVASFSQISFQTTSPKISTSRNKRFTIPLTEMRFIAFLNSFSAVLNRAQLIYFSLGIYFANAFF